MMNKWNINKVEGRPTKFGTGAHITLPKDWLEKDVVVVTKDIWVVGITTKMIPTTESRISSAGFQLVDGAAIGFGVGYLYLSRSSSAPTYDRLPKPR
jgi:hypothetical protein